MKNNYNSGQQIIVCIFLVNLVLQSCSSLTNPPIPIEKSQTDNAKVSFEELTDTKFIAKEEQIVTFCNQAGQLQAEVLEKQPEGFSKSPALPIYAADDMDLTQAASSKEEQKQLIHANLSREQQPGYVHVANLGLMERGKDGDEKSKKQEKRKVKEVVKKPVVVKQRRLEEKGRECLIKEEEVASLNKERQKQPIPENLLKKEQSGYMYVGRMGLKKGGGNTKGNSMPSLPGYKLLNCLHEGISSNIYRAVRLSDERPVVIKVSAQKALTEKEAQPFRREFELGQQINSPHVVRYLELQQDLAYGIALVMEDDQAVELTSVIPPQGFSNSEFLEIAIQIVEGLQAIHAANIIHNDLKPSNIMIQSATHMIKINDFSC